MIGFWPDFWNVKPRRPSNRWCLLEKNELLNDELNAGLGELRRNRQTVVGGQSELQFRFSERAG
jgi:hypothetical protein